MYRLFIIFLLLVTTGIKLQAQSLHHQMLSCLGGVSSNSNEIIVFFTVGQQTIAGTYDNGMIVQQGFQQSNWNKITNKNSISLVTTVYPNPFIDKVNFSFSKSPGDKLDLIVNDILGRVVYFESIKNENNLISVNLSKLPSSTYLISMSSNNFVYSTKIIKQ